MFQKIEGEEEEQAEMVDIEGEGEYEEYTWAGQTRIRATTMLPGGLAGTLGIHGTHWELPINPLGTDR